MKNADNVRILLYPMTKNDRRGDVEFITNNGYTLFELETVLPDDVEVYTLTDFMDLCNDQAFNLNAYWFGYINIIEDDREPIEFERITIIQDEDDSEPSDNITTVDVASVARDLKITLTDKQILDITTEYPNVAKDHPKDEIWVFVVEDMIHQAIKDQK